jgi:hypothetical protein
MNKTVNRLLKQMQEIANALIVTIYITDFTVHDTQFIRDTNGNTPFLWLVYNSGTHLYATNDSNRIKCFLETLDYYERYSYADFYVYQYDGNKLFPVFPTITRVLTNNQLTKLQNNKNK